MKIITKYGYAKSIKGEISVEMQREHLIKNGVLKDHIYEGDTGQTIFDAINSFEWDEDQIVIYSGAVIGKWNFKKMNKVMATIPQTLYLCKGDVTVEFKEGEEFDALLGHIDACERRTRVKGGRHASVTLKDHKRIHKLRDDGFNPRQICEALDWDFEKKGTTVWRWMKRPIDEKKGDK